jgi:hypothetical protein
MRGEKMKELDRFNRRFEKNERFFDFWFKFIFGAIIILFIAWIAFVGWGVSKAVNTDWSHGVKGVVEKVWCGEKGC